jgi:hypothetical protein
MITVPLIQTKALLRSANLHTEADAVSRIPVYVYYDYDQDRQYYLLNVADLEEVLTHKAYTLVVNMMQPDEYNDNDLLTQCVMKLTKAEEVELPSSRCFSTNNE